jgi:GlpG protein
MALCVLMTFASNFGDDDHSLTRTLLISTQRPDVEGGRVGLIEVRSGEIWRLVTPMFLHFTYPVPTGTPNPFAEGLSLLFHYFAHLLFNLVLFLPLAGRIESVRGTRSLALLILAIALASNLTQYYLGSSTVQGVRLVLGGSFYFGGLSGVVYGLFGYVWIRGRLEPDSGLGVSTAMAVLLLAWLLVGPLLVGAKIANGAHFGGLLAGALIAAAPALWRRPPPRDEAPPQDDEGSEP